MQTNAGTLTDLRGPDSDACADAAEWFREPSTSRFCVEKHLLGGNFRFESDSEALLRLVESAYGGLPRHELPAVECDFRVLMRLTRRGVRTTGAGLPNVRVRSSTDRVRAVIDDSNYVLISPRLRSAVVVISDDMLHHAYYLRRELIEFAVFVLAARGMGLVPLHAACVGRHGKGVLLLGESGSGKSTLALLGMTRGLELLAEDTVFVQPDGMLATGIANFLHVRADTSPSLHDEATWHWIRQAPVIRRRSGVDKFEIDAREGQGRIAQAPVSLMGAIFMSRQPSGNSHVLLTPIHTNAISARLDADQPQAALQPGWQGFKRRLTQLGVRELKRGRRPRDSAEALLRMLA